MTILSVDFETRSTVELKRTGVYKYAKHPDTDVWCMAYAFDEEEPLIWNIGQGPLPERIEEHINVGDPLRAWNAQFERTIWREIMTARYGWPEPLLEQWFCTAAEGAAMALPRALAQCAQVLGLPTQKDMAGYRLMLKMCRPRKWTEDDSEIQWWDDPANLMALCQYCKQDVRTERAIAHQIRRLTPGEREVYLLDQKMNDRGVNVDYLLVAKAKDMADAEVKRQNKLLHAATSGKVERVTKVAKLKEWLAAQGEDVESLNKKALDELLSDKAALSPDVAAALDARREGAKSSIAKLDSILNVVDRDNRVRGLFLYHGASTGRWTGKLVQPQNFPRGLLSPVEIEPSIAWVLQGGTGTIVPRVGTMGAISSLLRSMLTAAPGNELYCADFAAIEARVLAWVAGCDLMLDQFRAGKPVYKEMGSVIYAKPVADIIKPSEEYHVAKSTVLGCGFGMGGKHFAEYANVDRATADAAVKAYRSLYPEVPQLWDAANSAAKMAVLAPGEVFRAGNVKFTKRDRFLYIFLPAKRVLCYFEPKIVQRPMPWDAKDMRPAVEFSGMNSYTHQWERLCLYGGLIVENIVQAIARDLLAEAMLRIEAAGFPVVMTVHDEVVCETSNGRAFQDFDRFMALMTVVPGWAAGCPIGAEGWHGIRYRK